MARLPLVINQQRIKTLEELRENFNLAELIERYRRGLLKAWLYNWDFEDELKAVENIPAEQTDMELAERLCSIFQIPSEAQEKAIDDFRGSQKEKKELEQKLVDSLKQIELEKQQRENLKLTIDNIEFSWEEATIPGDVKCVSSVNGRLVAIGEKNLVYSYDGIHWQKAKCDQIPGCFDDSRLDFINGTYILNAGYHGLYYSSDLEQWRSIKADGKAVFRTVWDGNRYYSLWDSPKTFTYTKKVLFSDTTDTATYNAPAIYSATDLKGPWRLERIEDYHEGDLFNDICIFNHKMVVTGRKDSGYVLARHSSDEAFLYRGSAPNDLKRIVLDVGSCDSRLFCSENWCFRFKDNSDRYDSSACHSAISSDGWNFSECSYGISSICAADKFLISSQYTTILGGKFIGERIGIYISFNEDSKSVLIWYKLKTPVDDGNLLYFNDKVIIQNGNKLHIGTWKVKSDK